MQVPVRKYLFIRWALSLALASTAAGQSRMSGVYVGHGRDFAEMLQLTQTNNGQISGVLSSVELKEQGNIQSQQTPVTGSVDAGQVTLKLGSFIFANTLAGTFNGNTVRLQITDSKGNVTSLYLCAAAPTNSNAMQTACKPRTKASDSPLTSRARRNNSGRRLRKLKNGLRTRSCRSGACHESRMLTTGSNARCSP